MTDHDKKNLEFLLGVDAATLADWYKQADADSIAYARELLLFASIELAMQAYELMDRVEDVSEAAAYLSKFRK